MGHLLSLKGQFSGDIKKIKGGKTDLKEEPRPGQPRKAVTKADVAAVADMVKQDARFTVKEIADSAGVSSGTVHKILTQELKLRKVCARWVPHLFTKEQKTTRVKMAKNLLKKYKKFDKRRILELLTGDENWVYYFEPQRRINNKQWLRKDQAWPVIAKRIKSAQKFCMPRYFSIAMDPLFKFPYQMARQSQVNFIRMVCFQK